MDLLWALMAIEFKLCYQIDLGSSLINYLNLSFSDQMQIFSH